MERAKLIEKLNYYENCLDKIKSADYPEELFEEVAALREKANELEKRIKKEYDENRSSDAVKCLNYIDLLNELIRECADDVVEGSEVCTQPAIEEQPIEVASSQEVAPIDPFAITRE